MTTRTAAAAAPHAGRRAAVAAAPAVAAAATVYAVGRFATSRILAADSGAAFDAPAELVAAIIVGGTLTTLARRLVGSTAERVRALWVVAFASVAAVMLEGSVFAPGASPLARLPLGMVLEAATCLAAAALAVAGTRSADGDRPRRGRSVPSTAALLLTAALVYVVAYVAAGAADYLVVTGPYYASHAGGLTTPPAAIVLPVALAEGLLLAAGSLPVAAGLAGSWAARGLVCGLALWVLGGLVPLLQATTLPDVVRVASLVEILFQKVPLGIAVVWLLDGRAAAAGGRPS